jgi:hypothetical protein
MMVGPTAPVVPGGAARRWPAAQAEQTSMIAAVPSVIESPPIW